ncbi:HD domain-containing protein [Oleidesulfovibrio alaskensis]|uniref:HD domain-containing protein n=1 Tax=Oleidesulfovibrio alaskensis TaxID=58180 RepID=UPI00040FDB0C|nr:HD domain-containing protein [Oleidesulfovibrio alaskensis]
MAGCPVFAHAGAVQAAAGNDIDAHRRWFAQYADWHLQACSGDDEPLRLKTGHTWRVLENAAAMVRVAAAEKDSPFYRREELQRAALLAALYHDTGRFPQYMRWGTFNDRTSANHGLLGCRTLRSLGVLGAEKTGVRRLALGAVVLHNRRSLPRGIPEELRSVTDVVRDADKIDIMGVIACYLRPDGPRNDVVTLDLQDCPACWSRSVAAAVQAGEQVGYEDMCYLNDFILLLCSWVYGFRNRAALRLVKEQGVMAALVRQLPEDGTGVLDDIRAGVLAAVAV